nr:MAG TPA: hypothetical protein [Caudoviricetes sp.]
MPRHSASPTSRPCTTSAIRMPYYTAARCRCPRMRTTTETLYRTMRPRMLITQTYSMILQTKRL